jgi:hypothetical protein
MMMIQLICCDQTAQYQQRNHHSKTMVNERTYHSMGPALTLKNMNADKLLVFQQHKHQSGKIKVITHTHTHILV